MSVFLYELYLMSWLRWFSGGGKCSVTKNLQAGVGLDGQ